MKTTARILAFLLIAAALWPRGVARHERMLVVGLDGAVLEDVERLAAAGALPTLKRLIDQGVVAKIHGGSSGGRDDFWDAGLAGVTPDAVDGEVPPSIWNVMAASGGRVVVVGVPGTEQADLDRGVVLPGANAIDGFIGDNTGIVTTLGRLQKGDVEWPYSGAAGRIAQWAHDLNAGQASPWIGVAQPAPDGRSGAFRIYALGEDLAYLTPVYRRTVAAEEYVSQHEGLIYVADEPTWVAPSSRLEEYFYAHMSDLAGDRGTLAVALAQGAWELMVYVDDLLLPTYYIYGRDGAAAGEHSVDRLPALEKAYREVDARIGRLVEAAGPEAVIVVIGRAADELPPAAEEQPAAESRPTGWLVVAGTEGARTSTTTDIDDIAPTLFYLLGLPGGATASGEPMRAVRARFWRSPVRSLFAVAGLPRSREVPFTAESLERLGVLSDSAEAPDRAADGDASVDSNTR